MLVDSIDTVCGASGVGFDSFEEKEESQSMHFSRAIFVPPYYPVDFDKQATLEFQTKESLKAGSIVNDRLANKVTKSRGRGSDRDSGPYGEFEATVHWGGSDGPQWEVGGTAGYKDPDGNYVEGSTTYNSDGEGSSSVRGGNTNDEE